MSELVLTVATYSGSPPRETMQFRLGDGVGILGRRAGCDLELPDPECVVSGQHARVEMQGQTAVITDLSTNGTYLNGVQQPIGQNESAPLTDGDRLHIGPYELTVSIVTGATCSDLELTAQRPAGQSLLPATSSQSDIIDLLGADSASLSGPGVAFDGSPLTDIPSAQSPAEPSRRSVDHLHFTLPTSGASAAGAKVGSADRSSLESSSLEQPGQPPPSPAVPDGYDLFSDAFGPSADTPEQSPHVIEDLPNESSTTQQVAALSEQPPEISADGRNAVSREIPSNASEPHQRDRQVQGSVGERVSLSQSEPTSRELNAFLDGLGITNSPPDVDRVALMQRSGALLRQMTEGLMAVMRARAAFKSELRLEVTTIRSRANNPFQFCVDAEDALDRLLWRQTPGFLDPDVAASKAFDDIQAHQMAMMAGLRAALSAIVSHFEPARLQQRVDSNKGLDRLMPGGQKAKCWEQFVAAFDQVADDASEDFMRVFGEAFNRAYEDQVQRLTNARMQDSSSR